jgi:hypothetical protein
MLCTFCVQEGRFEGPENGPKQRRINNRLLSYRPFELEWRLETTRAVYDGSAKSAIASRFWCIHPIVLMLATAQVNDVADDVG